MSVLHALSFLTFPFPLLVHRSFYPSCFKWINRGFFKHLLHWLFPHPLHFSCSLIIFSSCLKKSWYKFKNRTIIIILYVVVIVTVIYTVYPPHTCFKHILNIHPFSFAYPVQGCRCAEPILDTRGTTWAGPQSDTGLKGLVRISRWHSLCACMLSL